MIKIEDKKLCCGCTACVNICPQKCIPMVEDDEGFAYPVVDVKRCIGCGLCNKVCPIENNSTEDEKPKAVYGCINKNEKILKSSSSGGVFASLASAVIDQGGVVFGALLDQNMNVVHGYTKNEKDIIKLQGSKYVQSDMKDNFQQVKQFLKEGKTVLFSGTPCQVSGLKHFLQKDYKNLITCDFICTGVPSPKIYRAICKYYENKYHSKLINIQFRNKKNGWNNFGLVLEFANNQKKYISRYDCSYFTAHFSHFTLRLSCYDCKFKELNSGSDIKLGDFWNIKSLYPDFYNFNGVSIVIIGSEKGQRLFNSVKNRFKLQVTNYQEVIKVNRAIVEVSKEPSIRKTFFDAVKVSDEITIVKLLNKFMKKPLKVRIREHIFVIASNIKNKFKWN
jgi:coenzyme F420-reducing hydrogenase beta subunit